MKHAFRPFVSHRTAPAPSKRAESFRESQSRKLNCNSPVMHNLALDPRFSFWLSSHSVIKYRWSLVRRRESSIKISSRNQTAVPRSKKVQGVEVAERQKESSDLIKPTAAKPPERAVTFIQWADTAGRNGQVFWPKINLKTRLCV